MDDQRVWEFEGSLWDANDEHYQDRIDKEIVMVLPRPPYLFQGQEAKDAVKATPDWIRSSCRTDECHALRRV